VGNLDEMTQQNAALVEESAAAAESLKEQARALAGVVSTFRLAGAPASSTAATPPAARATSPAARAARPAEPALATAGAAWTAF
jgi:hypothetical protein